MSRLAFDADVLVHRPEGDASSPTTEEPHVHIVRTNHLKNVGSPQHCLTTESAVTWGNGISRHCPSPLRTPLIWLIIPRSRVRVPPAPQTLYYFGSGSPLAAMSR